ncbi:MAG TPA: hypothetical protein VLL05_11125 [Terriglobales bacterium]|nr:hypothetical protein [Terriglobales bacterium]
MRLRRLVPLVLSSFSLAQSFTVQTSNSTENLRGLSAVSSLIIWASGTHGTYLRTVDGGVTWSSAQVPGAETLDFRDVAAFSADEAYVLAAGPGDQSRIYKTADAGKTWTLQFTNGDPKGFYDCMAFGDRTHGIALGDPIDGVFELIATEDGVHWAPLPEAASPRSLAQEGAFAASGTCIVTQGEQVWFVTGGSAARVLRSANRGNTWSAADLPLVKDNVSSGAFSAVLDGRGRAIVGGGDYQHPERNPTLAISDDGGFTWQVLPVRQQSYFSAVALDPANPQHLLAVGSAHAAYTDNLQGEIWKAYWDLNLNAAAFVGPGDAIAVGPQGKIVRFTLP